MPSLQLDVGTPMTVEEKRRLAERLGAEYSRTMGSDPRLMTVVVRVLPEGSVWRFTEAGAAPGALLMCDVRAGRDRETRLVLAQRLVRLVAEHTGVEADAVKVEFTQHAGDEMYHPFLGGFNVDWSASEHDRGDDADRA